MSTRNCTVCVTILVLVVNSNQFQILRTRSYSNCPFLRALGPATVVAVVAVVVVVIVVVVVAVVVVVVVVVVVTLLLLLLL